MINRVDMYYLASSMSRWGTKAQRRLNRRDKGSKRCRLPPRVQLLPLEGKSCCGLERQSAEVGHSSGKIPDRTWPHDHIRSRVRGDVVGKHWSNLPRLKAGVRRWLDRGPVVTFTLGECANVMPFGIWLALDKDWV